MLRKALTMTFSKFVCLLATGLLKDANCTKALSQSVIIDRGWSKLLLGTISISLSVLPKEEEAISE